MIIWIITTGEQLPYIDGENIRLWRSVLLSEALVKKGHQVVRWSSSFDHSIKKHRFTEDREITVNNNYKIKFIKSLGYKRNISIKRIIDHIITARRFAKLALNEQKPDVILCSLPTIELCVEATNFGKFFNVPVVIDGRDMWPDMFMETFPKKLQFLGRLLLYPMFHQIKKACQNATFLSGISEPYIAWELKYANRGRKQYDKSFTHGHVNNLPAQNEIKKGFAFWQEIGVNMNDFNICLFTAMGNVLDMGTIVNAAKILSETHPKIKFILCGDGVKLEEFRNMAEGIENVIFPGWVNNYQIWTLMRLSKVGILPYWNIDNYKNNIPNKPIEYLSAGLPVISSVSGLVQELIEINNCGFYYKNGDYNTLTCIIVELFTNFALQQELSYNAKTLFESKFTAEIVYEQMADYLIEIGNNFNE